LKASIERLPVPLVAQSDAKMVTPTHARVLPEQLSQIYDEYFDFVWRSARRLGVSESSADDVAQDVFVIVQRRIADYDGRASLQTWMFSILVRVVHDYRRSFRRKGSRNVPFEHGAGCETAAAPDPSPVEQAERAEDVRLIDKLLGELDEDKRTLLILSELEDWTLREIAEYFGSNPNTIFSRLRAAKRAFEQAYLRVRGSEEELP
jgi:RNA polymerase sigma-70 factor (ECF subfamily)